MSVVENTDIRCTISEWLNSNERTFGWLVKKTGYNYHTLYSILILKKVQLSDDKLEKINEVLGTKFKK